jgi:hypothetical protein
MFHIIVASKIFHVVQPRKQTVIMYRKVEYSKGKIVTWNLIEIHIVKLNCHERILNLEQVKNAV